MHVLLTPFCETEWLSNDDYSFFPSPRFGEKRPGDEGLGSEKFEVRSGNASSSAVLDFLTSHASYLKPALQVPIEQVPLGARVPTKNPKPWEYDDSLPDPVQADWAKISITMRRTDGGIIEGTPIHPIWSVDRNDWVPLGELTEGESLQAADGLATVLSILVTNDSKPVYNIEVHGEHVYQAGELELLVHNGNLTCEMLGLDEAHYFVDGTIDLMDDTVFVYVRQLKKLDDAKGQGFAIWGVTRNLLNSAKNLGGRAIYGEAHVKEVTGRLEALLLRQGWRGTNDGFKIFLMKDL